MVSQLKFLHALVLVGKRALTPNVSKKILFIQMPRG
jgi:hypothetical protein